MIKKRLASFVVAVAMMFAVISTTDLGIEVRATTPILIGSVGDLQKIGVITATHPLDGDYQLTTDIDLSTTTPWTPLGTTTSAYFTGTFDGNGKVIKGLTSNNGGLFLGLGNGTANVVIKNLGFDNATITGTGAFAGIITADGDDTKLSVKNCYATNSSVTITGVTTTGKELLGNAPNSSVTGYYYGPANTSSTTKIVKFGTDINGSIVVKQYTTPALNGGSGMSYFVSSAADMTEISKLVNDGVAGFSQAAYFLTNDITLDGSFAPIGHKLMPFSGTFNGNYKVINATIGQNSVGDAGIFGTTKDARIDNLGINVSTISGTGNIGALIGTATGGEVIQKCYSKGGTISSTTNAGGLIGKTEASTKLLNCYSTVNVYGGGGITAGLVGDSVGSTSMTNCYTTAASLAGKNPLSTTTSTPVNSFSQGASNGTATRTLDEMKAPAFVNTLNGTPSTDFYCVMPGSTPALKGFAEAAYSTVPYQLVFDKPTGGKIEVRNASGVLVNSKDYFVQGTPLTVKAIPENGYSLVSIKTIINGTSTALPNDSVFYMSGNPVTIVAEFEKYESYTITVVKNDGGTVTPSDSTVMVKKNTAQAFKIIPNADCKIKSVTYTGNGMTIDGDTYTTGSVSKNETLTVKFASKSDGVKDTTVTPEGKVITVKSIEDIIDQINDDNVGSTIKVSVDNPIIDKKTLAALQDYNINVVLSMGLYSWRINGRSISDSSSSINLGTNISASSIDSKYMSQFVNYKDKTQLDLTYTGALPFTGYLTLKAPGTNSIGKYANLFYFNELTTTFEAMDSVKVADDGNVTFKFNHCSRYVIAIADTPITAQDLSVGAGKADRSIPISKKTTDIIFASLLLLLVAAGGITLTAVIRKSK